MFKSFKEKLRNWTKKVSEDINSAEQEFPETEQNKKSEKPEKGISFEKGKETSDKQKEDIPIKKGKIKISEKKLKEYFDELEFLLLENNVALEISEKIIDELKERVFEKSIDKKNIENEIRHLLKKIIKDVLVEAPDLIAEIKSKPSKPYVILFCGINGTGKTTTIAKLGNYLKLNGLSCVFAAADTFRAASIEQLKKHGENLGIKVIASNYGADPASVGFDAINHAKKNNIDCVLVDTAGRMHTDKNLLKEIEKISRVCSPDLKIFVGESITGNDSVEQLKKFNEAVKIDAIILSKADIDEKGGTALSLGYITKKPILFLGTGQEYKDLEKFDKHKFITKLGL